MMDLNKVVKSIEMVAKQGKSGKNYFVKVTLVNGSTTDIFMERELYDAVKTINEITGKSAIKRKELVTEISEKTNEPYTCILIELVDGSIFRFFAKRSFDIIVKTLASQLEDKK